VIRVDPNGTSGASGAPDMCRPHASLLAAGAAEHEPRAISRRAERRRPPTPLVRGSVADVTKQYRTELRLRNHPCLPALSNSRRTAMRENPGAARNCGVRLIGSAAAEDYPTTNFGPAPGAANRFAIRRRALSTRAMVDAVVAFRIVVIETPFQLGPDVLATVFPTASDPRYSFRQ
jgi:hypothetical protein